MKRKILVINDSETIRKIVRFYLEMKEYEVIEGINGPDGIEKAKVHLPHLILLDVIMPGMNGFEVCRELKKNQNTQEIPVIFLSSLNETNDKIQGLESGGVDFINNSTDQGEIHARIETHLKIQELTCDLKKSNQELMIKQKALNEDLQAAGVIQQSLLPDKIPIIPNIQLAWTCHPCALVGGDICNITPVDDDQLILYLLDVSGHGVPSAMVTVSMTQYLGQKDVMTQSHSPKQILKQLNREYPFEKFNMFSTIFYMTLNPQNGRFIYSNAGHPDGVYLSPHKPLKLLGGTGPLIGVDPKGDFEEVEDSLKQGDKIFLYTDGLIEFRNSKGEFYGSERLYDLLEEIKHHSIHEIVQLVSDSLQEFGEGKPPQDDVSLLGVEFQK